MKKTKYGLLLALASLVLAGCGGSKDPTPAPSTPAPTPSTPAPSTPAPSTPAPSTPAPSTPAPSTPAPSTPAPSTPSPTPVTLTSIEVSGAKSQFKIGEEFSAEGLVVRARYSDNRIAEVSGYSIDADDFDNTLVGTYSIIVSYAEGGINVEDSYDVTVDHNFTLSTSLIVGDPYDFVDLESAIEVEGVSFDSLDWTIDNEAVAALDISEDGSYLIFVGEGETTLVATYTVYDAEENPIDDIAEVIVSVNPKTRWGQLELYEFADYFGTLDFPYVAGLEYYGYYEDDECGYFIGFGLGSEDINDIRDQLEAFGYTKCIDYGEKIFNAAEGDNYIYEIWMLDVELLENVYYSVELDLIVFNESGQGLSPTGEGVLQMSASVDSDFYAKSFTKEDVAAAVEAFDSPLLAIPTDNLPELAADKVLDASTGNVVDYAGIYYPESDAGKNIYDIAGEVFTALQAEFGEPVDYDVESYDYQIYEFRSSNDDETVYFLFAEPGYTDEGANFGYIEIVAGARAERVDFHFAEDIAVKAGGTIDLLDYVEYDINFPFVNAEIEFALAEDYEGVYLTDWIDELFYGIPAGTLYALVPGEYNLIATDGEIEVEFTVTVLESSLVDYAWFVAESAFADFDMEVPENAIVDYEDAVVVYTPLAQQFLTASAWTQPEDILENYEDAVDAFAYYIASYYPINFNVDDEHIFVEYDDELNTIYMYVFGFDPELNIMITAYGSFFIDSELGCAVVLCDYFVVEHTTSETFYYAVLTPGQSEFVVGDEFTTDGLVVVAVGFDGSITPIDEYELEVTDLLDNPVEDPTGIAGTNFVNIYIDGELVEYYPIAILPASFEEALRGFMDKFALLYNYFYEGIGEFEIDEEAYFINDGIAVYGFDRFIYDVFDYDLVLEDYAEWVDLYADYYEMTAEEVEERFGEDLLEAAFEEIGEWLIDYLYLGAMVPNGWTVELYNYYLDEYGYNFTYALYNEDATFVTLFSTRLENVYTEPETPTSIVGEWEGKLGYNDVNLVVNEDGSVLFNGEAVEAVIEENVLTFTAADYNFTFTYEDGVVNAHSEDAYEGYTFDGVLTAVEELPELLYQQLVITSAMTFDGTESINAYVFGEPETLEYYVGETFSNDGAYFAYQTIAQYLLEDGYYVVDNAEDGLIYAIYDSQGQFVSGYYYDDELEELCFKEPTAFEEAGYYYLVLSFGSYKEVFSISVGDVPTYPELAGEYEGTFGAANATITLGDDATGTIAVDGGATINFTWFLDENDNFVFINVKDNSGLYSDLELAFVDGAIVGSIYDDDAMVTLDIQASLKEVKTIAGTWEGKVGYNEITLTVYTDGTVEFNGEIIENAEVSENSVSFTLVDGTQYSFLYENEVVAASIVNEDEFIDLSGELARTAEAQDFPEVLGGDNICGTWEGKVGYNNITLVIYTDGTVLINGELVENAEVSENSVSFTLVDGTQYTFLYENEVVSASIVNEDEFIDLSGELARTANAEANPDAKAVAAAGTWEGKVGLNNMTLEVLDDGTVILNDNEVENVCFDGDTLSFQIGDYIYSFELDSENNTINVSIIDEYETPVADGVLNKVVL